MSSTDTATENSKKRSVATHALLNSAGEVVDDEESASGARYTLNALPTTPVDYQYGQNPNADKLFALFGFKTLATNETSQVRNNLKGDAGPAAQLEAVNSRMALVKTGQWLDRTREPGVGAINKDALVRAIATYATENGQPLSDDKLVALRQKVEEDKVYVKGVRSHTRIAALYAAETGKPQVTDQDIFSGL
jgi:hypothetical protein